MAIRFFYRPQCGLCHEIEGPLLSYAARFRVPVIHVNIDEDQAAFQRYWDKIPVIEIDGQATLVEPIDPATLQAAIRLAAGESHGQSKGWRSIFKLPPKI